ncbi:hypothetical protein QFC21_000242 [Naganishia friedmannii]|uniref:Uncharacterized protein n=1 Tax=Naganishia friedmannii TaxID=89922 RepID=A0ACC2WBZ9_9TREE|nr:hypothetical protein QFC21_000242 [Naganishia friedmannii]
MKTSPEEGVASMADVIHHDDEESLLSPQPSQQDAKSSPEQDAQATLEQEEKEGLEFQRRVPDYLQLHESVNSSTLLLDSLATFLATFQRDLSDVSGQIFELQNHSQEIDERSKGRKSIAKPLNALISDLILSPTLITTIRDTRPGDAWLPLIVELEQKVNTVKTNGKVKAAHEIGMVVEGLKAKAITSLRLFLLNLIKPIRASVKTNVQIIQSSILLKYLPFYHFLYRQSPRIAQEIQRAYVVSARAYYETCFRRYARSMSVIAARSPEYAEPIGTPSSAELAAHALLLNRGGLGVATRSSGANKDSGAGQASSSVFAVKDRLRFARVADQELDVVPGYEADNKEYKQPVEALFRSLLLVLLDNASAEYTFLVRFFSPPPPEIIPNTTATTTRNPTEMVSSPLSSDPSGAINTLISPMRRFDRKDSNWSMLSALQSAEGSPVSVPSPLRPADSISEAGGGDSDADRSFAASPISRPGTTRVRQASSFSQLRIGSVVGGFRSQRFGNEMPKDVRRELEALWHQVFDPALEYCEAFFRSVTEPVAPPPTIPLLTMLRLNDEVLAGLEARGCTPLESMVLGLKLGMWPLFQKQMDSHIDSVKRMADAASGTGFGAMLGRAGPKDSAVQEVRQDSPAQVMA